jgi:hypothetical protein
MEMHLRLLSNRVGTVGTLGTRLLTALRANDLRCPKFVYQDRLVPTGMKCLGLPENFDGLFDGHFGCDSATKPSRGVVACRSRGWPS